VNSCKITHIYEDRNANIWFCTETDGLYTVNSDLTSFNHFSVEHSLPDKSVASIMEDRSGFFWIATHKGLARCTFTDNKCRTFWLSDGLPGLTFNPGACFYDRSEDKLWWGNESGLVYCNPNDVHAEKSNCPIQITHFYVNGKEQTSVPPHNKVIDRTLQIKLSESQNSFGFNFAALNYIYPNDNTFETLLEGHEQDWQLLDRGQTSVYYGDIKPGKYIFRVRLSGYPGSEKHIGIAIYRTWSFLFWLLPLLGLCFLWFWYWKKVKTLIRKQKIQAKRKEIKKSITVKDNQQKIQMLLKLMEEQKPYLDRELKISYLATFLKCTPNELSQLLSSSLHQSFSDFINRYRIEEFKRKVNNREYEKYTILALSEQCGFSSRSSFFRIFKNITGITPAEYLKQFEKSGYIG
jgi:AraC-like DNA-binding protein